MWTSKVVRRGLIGYHPGIFLLKVTQTWEEIRINKGWLAVDSNVLVSNAAIIIMQFSVSNNQVNATYQITFQVTRNIVIVVQQQIHYIYGKFVSPSIVSQVLILHNS